MADPTDICYTVKLYGLQATVYWSDDEQSGSRMETARNRTNGGPPGVRHGLHAPIYEGFVESRCDSGTTVKRKCPVKTVRDRVSRSQLFSKDVHCLASRSDTLEGGCTSIVKLHLVMRT